MTIYQVDAFTNKLFGGNPAAVCPLEKWLPDSIMQKLAAENNLSETAFFVKNNETYDIRWFTPEFEIDLCGHATLASAYVIFNHSYHPTDQVVFNCKSGKLTVDRKGDLFKLNFPSRMPVPAKAPGNLLQSVNITPTKILKSRDYFLVYDDEEQVKNLVVDFSFLNQVETLGLIVTAKGRNVDFVSRFFVPNSVIGEDPVTGSAHCSLIPYWANELQKEKLTAKQLSAREGDLFCENKDDRVTMEGNAVLYMKGEYFL
jgi:PhzF family phenazine biosynthesis protein